MLALLIESLLNRFLMVTTPRTCTSCRSGTNSRVMHAALCLMFVPRLWGLCESMKTKPRHTKSISLRHTIKYETLKCRLLRARRQKRCRGQTGPAALREPFKTPWKWHVRTILDSGKPINRQFWLECSFLPLSCLSGSSLVSSWKSRWAETLWSRLRRLLLSAASRAALIRRLGLK